MSSGRLVLENILKYGFLVKFNIPILFIQDPTAWPNLLAIVCLNFNILAAFLIEKRLESGRLKEVMGVFLAHLNVTLALVLPAIYLWIRQANPSNTYFSILN
jgi:hypothetical protein